MPNDHLPNLVVIGAMKCGTTALHDYLERHPDIFMSTPKEVNYFSGNQSDRSLDWYKNLFPATCKIQGESSQNYSKAHLERFADAPRRMAETIPDAKLIYMVRDPIERYRSHVSENYVGEMPESIRWIEKTDHRLKTGLYHWQLSHFLKFYPIEQIRVVDLDDLARDRLEVMNGVFDFLGVDRVDDPAMFDFVSNPNGEDVVPPHLRRTFAYRAANRLAPGMLSRVVHRDAVRRRFFPGSYKPKLSLAEAARLREVYAPDVAALRALTGQPFSGWSL
ncbi:Sulfotransferase domain protein [Roseivivax jejudonensis]|uniref:Sulfotransferase domain protein n=1 Tax=Roseivivax jejudonensis TaxID=1529041 RepID=A0A1X6Y6G2_9RHOB|nr:sulfotransferase [Roseivivax jejudonensis]SLN11641.1 Sulfotransferase domain protein [Roseivivax jejudonensis]